MCLQDCSLFLSGGGFSPGRFAAIWPGSNPFAEGYYRAAVTCPSLLFIWELSGLSLSSPIALETPLAASRNVGAVLPHLLSLWLGTLFSRLRARTEKHRQQRWSPVWAAPIGMLAAVWDGALCPCPRLLLHPYEHDTIMPGDKGPSP